MRVSSVIITAVISCRHMKRNKTTSALPSTSPLLFQQNVSERIPSKKKWRQNKIEDRRGESDSETNLTQKRERETKKTKKERGDERLVFPTPRWFVMLEVRHISLGLPGALQECELLQQESTSSTSPLL